MEFALISHQLRCSTITLVRNAGFPLNVYLMGNLQGGQGLQKSDLGPGSLIKQEMRSGIRCSMISVTTSLFMLSLVERET